MDFRIWIISRFNAQDRRFLLYGVARTRFQRSIFNLTYRCSRLLITLKDQLNENKCTLGLHARMQPFLREEEKLLRRKLEEISRSNPLLKFNKSILRSSVKILQRTWNYHTLNPSTSPTIFAYLFIFISYGKLANRSSSQESKKPCFRKERLFRRNNWPRIIYPWASNRAIKLQIMLFVRIAITDGDAATNSCLTRACITRGQRTNLPTSDGSLCNDVACRLGAKSTSIKTNVNSHGRTRNDSHRGRYVKLHVPVPTYVSYYRNRRTVMRIHNAEFRLTLGLRFEQETQGNICHRYFLPFELVRRISRAKLSDFSTE